MEAEAVRQRNERYTVLSDRFRSLWTFYQFLGGVFKHQGQGAFPFKYDFQALYRRLQELVPRLTIDEDPQVEREIEQIERELTRIHTELGRLEVGFAPSTLRRFFDILKRQDEKILFAMVKFYLLSDFTQVDSLDKLDILLTRLAEAPLEDGRVLQRDPHELQSTYERLAEYSGLAKLPDEEERALTSAVREFRHELQRADDFGAMLSSRVFDRFRHFKQKIGRAYLHPPILVEVISTNIEAKNRFRQLYQEEEARILEDTNKILEIERYLERNPGLAHEDLTHKLQEFRRFRARFDSSRKEDNLKREEILELRKSMQAILDAFDPIRPAGTAPAPPPPMFEEEAELLSEPATESAPAAVAGGRMAPRGAAAGAAAASPARLADPPTRARSATESPDFAPAPSHDAATAEGPPRETSSLTELIPPDPLLSETLHKLFFALELVAWDYTPEEVVRAKEVHHLKLELAEVESFIKLANRTAVPGTILGEMHLFLLMSAALRVKMDEEIEEIARLNRGSSSDRLFEMLEHSAQSLERAREMDRRFQWFVEDLLYRGETAGLEQVLRSRHRFLRTFSSLWLDHQAAGGVTPL